MYSVISKTTQETSEEDSYSVEDFYNSNVNIRKCSSLQLVTFATTKCTNSEKNSPMCLILPKYTSKYWITYGHKLEKVNIFFYPNTFKQHNPSWH